MSQRSDPDGFDPFVLRGELQAAPKRASVELPPVERIPPGEYARCCAIGRRASAAIVAAAQANPTRNIVPPSWVWCAAVVAYVHVQCPLDLERFQGAPDLDFLGEYLTLEAHLEKNACYWPPQASALLKFKAPGKTLLEKIWLPFQKAH